MMLRCELWYAPSAVDTKPLTDVSTWARMVRRWHCAVFQRIRVEFKEHGLLSKGTFKERFGMLCIRLLVVVAVLMP